MGNKDNRIALVFQVFQLHEQFRRLLRREHGSRLIHDQDFGTAYQRFEDFNLLLHPDRDIHHFGFRLYMEVELLGILFCDFNGFRFVDKDAGFLWNHPEHHVFRHGQARHQHEMLMHHSDAVRDGNGRGTQIQHFPVHDNLSACRLFQAEKHFH